MSSMRARWFSAPMSSSRAGSPSSASISATFLAALARPSPSKAMTRRLARSNTPRKFLPQPIGQFMGQVPMPSTFSISSMSSNGSRISRSSLFTKVKMGMPRRAHTRKSFTVCASTPLAPSITITAASAAMSVR